MFQGVRELPRIGTRVEEIFSVTVSGKDDEWLALGGWKYWDDVLSGFTNGTTVASRKFKSLFYLAVKAGIHVISVTCRRFHSANEHLHGVLLSSPATSSADCRKA